MSRNPFAALRAMREEAAPPAPRRANGAKERLARAQAALGQFDPRRALAGLAGPLVPGLARVVVPFPPGGLNPNARHAHPARKGALAGAYRETCRALALEALGAGFARRHFPGDQPVRGHLDFFPPGGRRRDDANLEAAFQAGRDGIAAAMGCDDARWRVTRRLRGEVRGCVVATIRPEGELAL